MTPFADLTHEEYKTMLGLKFKPRTNRQEKNYTQVIFLLPIYKVITNLSNPSFLRKTVTFRILWIGEIEELLHQ